MGLYVHSIEELPESATRSYYIYVLDYGWHERLGDTLKTNLPKMISLASKNDAVIIKGIESNHFEDEVFSYHGINGISSDEILPAILVTTLHPSYFQKVGGKRGLTNKFEDNLLLIPLKGLCKTSSDVVELIAKLFIDIKEKKKLADFSVRAKIEKQKSGWRSITNALILEPNFAGVGIDLKKIGVFFKGEDTSSR